MMVAHPRTLGNPSVMAGDGRPRPLEDLCEAHSSRALSRRGTGSPHLGAHLSLRSPPSDRLGVLGIVTVGIQAQAATIAGFASQLRVRSSHDCIYDLSMDLLPLAVDLCERQARL